MSAGNINNLLDLINEDSYDIEEEAPTILQHSPYLDVDGLNNVFSKLPNTFKILSLNAQSLNAKFNELQIYVEGTCKSKFNAICIQETWLYESSDLSLLQLNGYNLISRGKSASQHGGVAIYLKENIRYKVLDINSQSNIWDGLFIETALHQSLHRHSNKSIVIGNIYRPPRDIIANYNTFMMELEQILHDLQTTNKEIIIAGDFNIDLLQLKDRTIINEYFETIMANGFIPKITLPTRITDRSSTLIDNIFVKLSDNLSQTTAAVLLANISDHLPCFVSLDFLEIRNSSQKYIKTWSRSKKAYDSFKHEIMITCSIEKFHFTGTLAPNKNYDILHNVIQQAHNKHIPMKFVKFNKYRHKCNKWITSGILSSIRFRDKLYKKLKEADPNSNIYQTYKTNLSVYNSMLKKLIRTSKKSYYEFCFRKFRNDMKKKKYGIPSNLYSVKIKQVKIFLNILLSMVKMFLIKMLL
jgi:hypothetical protein